MTKDKAPFSFAYCYGCRAFNLSNCPLCANCLAEKKLTATEAKALFKAQQPSPPDNHVAAWAIPLTWTR